MISTGIPPLDEYLGGGWHPGSVVTFAGRVASGKSLLAMDTAIEQYFTGLNVGFVSMDLTAEALSHRRNCKLVDTKYSDLFTGHCNRERILAAEDRFQTFGKENNCRWDMMDHPSELADKGKRWDVVVVDTKGRWKVDYGSLDKQLKEAEVVQVKTIHLDRDGAVPLRCGFQADYAVRWELVTEGPVSKAEFTLTKYRHGPAPFKFTGTFKFERMRMDWRSNCGTP